MQENAPAPADDAMMQWCKPMNPLKEIQHISKVAPDPKWNGRSGGKKKAQGNCDDDDDGEGMNTKISL